MRKVCAFLIGLFFVFAIWVPSFASDMHFNGIRFEVAPYSSMNEPSEYSSQQEIPWLRLTARFGEVYAGAAYMRDEMCYGGQKTYIGSDWGILVGFEKEVIDKLSVFADAGYYFREVDKIHSFNEGLRYFLSSKYPQDSQPPFQDYSIEIQPALGITFGTRYSITKNLSLSAGVHFRSHDANVQGRNPCKSPEIRGCRGCNYCDSNAYWTSKYKEKRDMYFLGVAWDFSLL